MRRVVVTGLGIISPIGNSTQEVVASLREARSGITVSEDHKRLGFRSHVEGSLKVDIDASVDRRARRFMGDGAGYAYMAMEQALRDSGLEEKDSSNEKTGLIIGSGGPSTKSIVQTADITRDPERGPRRVGPFMVPRSMSSSCSAVLSTFFKIKGTSYSITSACATSAHCIGNAAELIQWGKQDIMFAGGGEEVHWTLAVHFDAMGALSSHYNDTPERASRPFDKDRDGFVIAGGGGVIVLEELEHAKARGAKIYGELVGYAASSDGYDMVAPSGDGAARCMRMAMEQVKSPIDYVNAHGTATKVGDVTEIGAMRAVFGKNLPPVNSTKSLTGHAQGAAGVHEAIYTLLQMNNGFIAKSANIDELDPEVADAPIARSRIDNPRLETVMSNSFGFGGTNATLIFKRHAA
jgi:3-oxoacyl-[acyl-carrier-protein] synthase-1